MKEQSTDPQWSTAMSLRKTHIVVLTSTEIIFIRSESRAAAHSRLGHLGVGCGLIMAGGGVGINRRTLLITVADKDLCVLREAEVSAKVVDALHASFASIRQNGTFIDI